MEQNTQINDFCEAAMLNKKHDPWVRRRQASAYAWVTISDCQYDNWWYKPFIGLQVFVELKFERNSNVLRTVTAVRIAGTKVHFGRDFDIKDISLT